MQSGELLGLEAEGLPGVLRSEVPGEQVAHRGGGSSPSLRGG